MSKNREKDPIDFNTFTLWDRDYKTSFTKKFKERKKWEASDPKKVLSFIPGTVQKILAKPGQIVKKGDPMFILESMKMMNIIRVPLDAKVKAIHVKLGEKIPKNHLMIEFE